MLCRAHYYYTPNGKFINMTFMIFISMTCFVIESSFISRCIHYTVQPWAKLSINISNSNHPSFTLPVISYAGLLPCCYPPFSHLDATKLKCQTTVDPLPPSASKTLVTVDKWLLSILRLSPSTLPKKGNRYREDRSSNQNNFFVFACIFIHEILWITYVSIFQLISSPWDWGVKLVITCNPIS
jgi:hypothetical protein